MKATTGEPSRLCYLEASRVASPAGELGGLTVQAGSEKPIGTLSGVLIDPAERRVRFLVVDSRRWLRGRKILIPTDCPAQVEPHTSTIRVDVAPGDIARLEDCDQFTIEPMSEEDMVQAMFARRVA